MYLGQSPINLTQDLLLSSDETCTTPTTSRNSVNTGLHLLLDKEKSTITSPEVKITLDSQKTVYLNTLGSNDLGEYKIPKKVPLKVLGSIIRTPRQINTFARTVSTKITYKPKGSNTGWQIVRKITTNQTQSQYIRPEKHTDHSH